MKEYIQLKIKKQLKNYIIGDIIHLEVARDELPTDVYWRERLKDAVLDDCVEIVKTKRKKKHKQKATKTDKLIEITDEV